jgi:hypothetical protein
MANDTPIKNATNRGALLDTDKIIISRVGQPAASSIAGSQITKIADFNNLDAKTVKQSLYADLPIASAGNNGRYYQTEQGIYKSNGSIWNKVGYTSGDLDTLLNTKANQSTTYTKTETNTLLDTKQATITASNGIQKVGVDIQGINATTSEKGVTQLSNAYNGTSQTLATTEKALNDGLAIKQNAITIGSTAQYFKGDLSLGDFATDAKSAVVEDAINNGVTNKAPSENAVFDALALKENSANKNQVNGYAGLGANGLISIDQIPNSAKFTRVGVADQAARYALTNTQVQNGDSVYQNDTQVLYLVKDDTSLSNANGYDILNQPVDWSSVLNKPSLVNTFNSRSGTVTSQNGDYTASQITNTPAGNISAINVQSAINELDNEKADKTTIYTQTETNSLLSVFSTAGQLIYVDVNNGSDATGDGTQLKPFRTLAGVIASSPNFGTKQAIYFQGVGNTGGGLVSTTNTTTIYIILSEKCELNTAITMPTTSGGLYILHGSITANIINNSTVSTGYLSLQNQVKIQATITNNSANYCEIQNLSSGDAANVTNTGTGLFSVINATTVNKLLNSGAGVINGIRIGTAKLPPEKSNGYLFLDGISNIVADASSNCVISSGTNAGILGINNINFLQSDFATQGKISQTNANAAHITLIGSTYSINQSSTISGFIKYTQDAVAICGLLSKRPSPLVNASKLYEDENGKTYYSNGSNWVQVGYGKSEIDTALNLKEDAFTKNTAFNKNFGITAGSVAEGNDGRLGTKAIDETAIANNKIQVYNSATGKLEYQDKPSGSTNLSITNKTATTLDIASDNGNDATVPQATITEAGLLIASDKVKLNNTTGTNSGDQDLSGLLTKADNLASVADQQTALNNITNVAAASTGQALVKKADGSAGFGDLGTGGNMSANVTGATYKVLISLNDTALLNGYTFPNVAARQIGLSELKVISNYTLAERDSLTWSSGDIIYNTTYFRLEKYNGTSWVSTDGTVGQLAFFDSATQPLHYQVADGSQVSRTGIYSELWTLNTSVNPSLTPSIFTITIANPAVITKTAHGLTNSERVRFTTTGALPTGITTGVDYIITVIDANTFKLSTSVANALAGTDIITTGTQSGVHSYTNTLYGQGNGTTTQNVADARGLFLRGTDSSGLINTAAFYGNGSLQNDDFKSHTHTNNTGTSQGNPTLPRISSGGSNTASNIDTSPGELNVLGSFSALTINSTGGTETRGKNYASTIYIKYL